MADYESNVSVSQIDFKLCIIRAAQRNLAKSQDPSKIMCSTNTHRHMFVVLILQCVYIIYRFIHCLLCLI